MNLTLSVGNAVELKCLTAFIELGYLCSVPYGNSAKYDFVVDVNGKFIRILCKASSYTRGHGYIDYGSFSFSCCTQTVNTRIIITYKYTTEDIDYFATWFNGKVYVIPVQECGKHKTLRIAPNLQGKMFNDASLYEIEKVFPTNLQNTVPSQEFIKEMRRNLKQYVCSVCGKPVTYGRDRCPACSHILARKVLRPSKEELLELIKTKPFLEIGRLYGVSDNTIRKWCIYYNLPHRKKDIQLLTSLNEGTSE